MSTLLLDLPPELLIPTLALLPPSSLLKFSQCSRYAQSLANSSLHTLNLEFGPPSYQEDFFLPTRRMPVEPSSRFFPLSSRRRSLATKHSHFHMLGRRDNQASTSSNAIYKSTIRIHNADSYGYSALISFQSVLLSSILARHRNALQNIDITLWAFTVPMAKAISELSALRFLSVRVQEPYFTKRSPQESCKAAQLAAWQILATSTVWAGRLLVLKIENADITDSCLFRLLEKNPYCRNLSLIKCALISSALWDFLGMDWKGRDTLQTLVVAECGGMLNTATLELIGKFQRLEVSPTY
jgi:hypothetical protein